MALRKPHRSYQCNPRLTVEEILAAKLDNVIMVKVVDMGVRTDCSGCMNGLDSGFIGEDAMFVVLCVQSLLIQYLQYINWC